MGAINVLIGLNESNRYIKKVESKIVPAYNIKPKKDIDYNLESYERDFIDNISSRVPNLKPFSNTNQKEAYLTAMSGDARRVRPLLLFLASLCGKGKINRQALISSGLSIEMIHKMSLILDDYFDGDLTRRGNPTFHTIYDGRTMMDTTKLLLQLSNNVFLNGINNLPIDQQRRLIVLYKQIIVDMGNGFIEDLDRTDRSITETEAYRINDLQSTTILTNSMLIGYSLHSQSEEKDDTYIVLENIGNAIGKTFQGFNDVENFLSEESQNSDKGHLYSDLDANRKNVVLGKVPRELFYPPYTDNDIIEYIRLNHLIDLTIEELSLGIAEIKKEINCLPSDIARDTLLFITNKTRDKVYKKIKRSKKQKENI